MSGKTKLIIDSLPSDKTSIVCCGSMERAEFLAKRIAEQRPDLKTEARHEKTKGDQILNQFWDDVDGETTPGFHVTEIAERDSFYVLCSPLLSALKEPENGK